MLGRTVQASGSRAWKMQGPRATEQQDYSEGVLNPGHDAGESLPLLQKPFTAHELVERVQAMITQQDR
jgi:hypothetical protein